MRAERLGATSRRYQAQTRECLRAASWVARSAPWLGGLGCRLFSRRDQGRGWGSCTLLRTYSQRRQLRGVRRYTDRASAQRAQHRVAAVWACSLWVVIKKSIRPRCPPCQGIASWLRLTPRLVIFDRNAVFQNRVQALAMLPRGAAMWKGHVGGAILVHPRGSGLIAVW